MLFLAIVGIFVAILFMSYSLLFASSNGGRYSNIKSDENVVFFLTHASLNEESQAWRIPIHGWIYEPQNSRFRKEAFVKILKEKYGLETTPESEPRFNRLVNLLISDNERGKKIIIKLGEKIYSLPESEPNGHFKTILNIPVTELNLAGHSFVDFKALTHDDEKRTFHGRVMMVPPEGESVISDIDDTVKYTYVTDKKKLIEYTFFKDFSAVNGMPALYKRWYDEGRRFHFVSSSPWYFYDPLQEFMEKEGFPPATLSLKSFRFRDSSIMNLFKKGTETKPIAIEEILNAYPRRTFTLVGDSGEQDPEVYADVALRYPAQIKNIYIRKVPGTNKDFDNIFANIERGKWFVFTEPSEL